VDEEKMKRELAERVERCHIDLRTRLERVERRCAADEETRRRGWSELEGRLMTADEKRQLFDDNLFRKMSMMTSEYIKILQEEGQALRALQIEIAEGRAQIRANTEAVLKVLDRLPPSGTE
jgi:hypothetical protein